MVRGLMMSASLVAVAVVTLVSAPALACKSHGASADAKTDGGTKPFAAGSPDAGTKPELSTGTKTDGGTKPYAADTKTDGGSKPLAADTKTDGGTKLSQGTELEQLLAATCSCNGRGDCTCKKGQCKCSKCGHHKSLEQEHTRVIERLGGKVNSAVIPQEARRDATAGTFI